MSNLAKVVSNGETRTKSNGNQYVWTTIEKDGVQGSAMYTLTAKDGHIKTLPKVGETVTVFNDNGNLSLKRSHVEMRDFAEENKAFASMFAVTEASEPQKAQ